MLSVMIYEPHDDVRAMLLDVLQALSRRVALKITATTTSLADMERYLQAETGIVLAVFGLTLRPDDNRDKCLALGRAVMQRNRDSYTVYCIHELEELDTLLVRCTRPAGILLNPFLRERVTACLEKIADDYAALSAEGGEEESLVLNAGTSTYRIPFEQIRYIEALDKKVNIFTSRQTITVRAALGSLIEALPESRFVRCHRSYVVNISHVRQTDFGAMLLSLDGGDQLPISRSSRDTLRQHLAEKR